MVDVLSGPCVSTATDWNSWHPKPVAYLYPKEWGCSRPGAFRPCEPDQLPPSLRECPLVTDTLILGVISLSQHSAGSMFALYLSLLLLLLTVASCVGGPCRACRSHGLGFCRTPTSQSLNRRRTLKPYSTFSTTTTHRRSRIRSPSLCEFLSSTRQEVSC